MPIKKREAETVNKKYEVLLGSEATVVDCESRIIYTEQNKENKILYPTNRKALCFQTKIIKSG